MLYVKHTSVKKYNGWNFPKFDKPYIQEAQQNPEHIKHEENYTKAHHNRNCLKPLTKRKIFKAAKNNEHKGLKHIKYIHKSISP